MLAHWVHRYLVSHAVIDPDDPETVMCGNDRTGRPSPAGVETIVFQDPRVTCGFVEGEPR